MLGAAGDSPSLILSLLQPRSHASFFLVFSNCIFRSLIKQDFQTLLSGKLLQGAEGQLGDEQQKKNNYQKK